MTTYFMFGKYSQQAMKDISPERTKKAVRLIEKLGGKVKAMYVLLGQYDLVMIVSFPGTEAVVAASVGMTKLTGISFLTAPATEVDRFDKLVTKVPRS